MQQTGTVGHSAKAKGEENVSTLHSFHVMRITYAVYLWFPPRDERFYVRHTRELTFAAQLASDLVWGT